MVGDEVLAHLNLLVEIDHTLGDSICRKIIIVNASTCCTISGADDDQLVVSNLIGSFELDLVLYEQCDVFLLLLDEPLSLLDSFANEKLCE